MNYKMCIIAMAALTTVWGCSSDDEDQNGLVQNFVTSEKPNWQIDWSWTDEVPTWVGPESNTYWCSMQLQVELSDELSALASDDDCMAAFIDGTCRGVSYLNVIDGKGIFLLNVEGAEEEIGDKVEIYYYNAQLKNTFNNTEAPTFEPNNLWGSQYIISQDVDQGNAKFPYVTRLQVPITEGSLPFTPAEDDVIGIFVGDECRGILTLGFDNTFFGMAYRRSETETGELRYYSSEKKGTYTIQKPLTLKEAYQLLEL